MIIGMARRVLELFLCKREWRKKNKHNQTTAASIFNTRLVDVGKYTYGQLNVMTYNDKNRLRIGNCCSIGPNVAFIVSAGHDYRKISTFPFRVKVMGEPQEAISKGDIIIDDDVWIGYGAIILSGVHIGQGAVIGAGAVVTRNVQPYAVVGGSPGKVLKYRYTDQVIDYLLTLDYGQLNNELIQEHIDELYEPLDGMPLEAIKKHYQWFPKKQTMSEG